MTYFVGMNTIAPGVVVEHHGDSRNRFYDDKEELATVECVLRQSLSCGM